MTNAASATVAAETAAKAGREPKIKNAAVRAIVAAAISTEKKAEARKKAIRKSYAMKGMKERYVQGKKDAWVAGKILARRAAKEQATAA